MLEQTLPHETPPADPQAPTAPREHAPRLSAHLVAVVFTERRYDTGAQKIWWFSQVHYVCIGTGRVQLVREGYGVVLDVPVAEVAQVYTIEQGVSRPVTYN